MYRAFVKGILTAEKIHKSSDRNSQDYLDVDEDVSSEVNSLWRLAEKQCSERTSGKETCSQSSFVTDPGWVVIRVFVSSTFNDFFNEREILVKKVFPELREWCHEKGMKFVECDLRWGIPKDTSTGDTILVCLDEIQRCRDETKDLPFFIGLIGERYGWIPKTEEVPDEAREKYGWIDGASITFNEILVGAYRDHNPNAAFFFRDEAVSKSVPDFFLERFVEQQQLPRHHLKILKQKLIERFPQQVFPYMCRMDGISTETGREQVKITELDDFAQRTLTFLKSAIERSYPDRNGNLDSVKDNAELDKRMQSLFVLDNAKRLIGRKSELEVLKEFSESGSSKHLETTDGAESGIRKAENWDLQDTDSEVCVIQGQSGLGKSALLSCFVQNCLKLEDSNTLEHLSWLPPSFPHNVRCIVSTSLHRPTASRLFEFPVLKLDLKALPREDLQQIMATYLGSFSKKLEPGQVEKIIEDTEADSPLWVMFMAEELRIFGDFRLIGHRIESFPHSLDEFLVQVLSRLIQEDNGKGVIRKVLCLVACSRSGGLPSQSLLRLCGDVETKEELPLIYWAQARRTLKPYLRVAMAVDDTVTFAHQAVFKAVNSLLLSPENLKKDWYIMLADYYQTWCSEPRVKNFNLPYYLQKANLKKRLVDFVTKDNDAYRLMPPWTRSHLIENARCRCLADAIMPNTAPVLLCHTCATFSRFHPSCNWPTKDCCMLCSNLCSGGHKIVHARACAMHAGMRGPKRYKCLNCNAVVQEKPNAPPGPMVPTPARLCLHCGFGNNARRCAHLTV